MSTHGILASPGRAHQEGTAACHMSARAGRGRCTATPPRPAAEVYDPLHDQRHVTKKVFASQAVIARAERG
jgi:hypothetical protein